MYNAWHMPLLAIVSAVLIIVGIMVLIIIFAQLIGGSISERYDAPYVKSTATVSAAILQTIHISKNQTVVELGCGNGRVLRALVAQSGCYGVGVDISAPLLALAKVASYFDGTQKNIQWKQENLFATEISQADVVYFFMTQAFASSDKLKDKLQRELKPGTVVISHWFEIPFLKTHEFAHLALGKHRTHFYMM